MGSAPSVLSMVRLTSARPSGGRPAVPAKMDVLHLAAAQALGALLAHDPGEGVDDVGLAEPFGPTTQVMRARAHRRRRGEGLEPLEGQRLEVHAGRSSSLVGGRPDRGPGRGDATGSPRGGGTRRRAVVPVARGTRVDRWCRSGAAGEVLVVVDDLGDDEAQEGLGELGVQPRLVGERAQPGHLGPLAPGVGGGHPRGGLELADGLRALEALGEQWTGPRRCCRCSSAGAPGPGDVAHGAIVGRSLARAPGVPTSDPGHPSRSRDMPTGGPGPGRVGRPRCSGLTSQRSRNPLSRSWARTTVGSRRHSRGRVGPRSTARRAAGRAAPRSRAAGPSATTSTRPSTVLRAQPTRPSSRAPARVHQRNPTPCNPAPHEQPWPAASSRPAPHPCPRILGSR